MFVETTQSMQRERQTQKAVINCFKFGFPFSVTIIKIDNEGRQGQNVPTEADGFKPGASDLLILLPTHIVPHTLLIECKTTKLVERKKGPRFHVEQTTQSEKQKEFQAEVTALGHFYAVLPTVAEAIKLIKDICDKNGLTPRIR